MKDMKKKLTVLSLVLALVLGMFCLTGCSLFEDDDDDDDDVKTEQREKRNDDKDDEEDDDDDEKSSKKSSKYDDEDEDEDDDEEITKKSSKYDDEDEDKEEEDKDDEEDDDDDLGLSELSGLTSDDIKVTEEEGKVILQYTDKITYTFYHNNKDVTGAEMSMDYETEAAAKNVVDSYERLKAYSNGEDTEEFKSVKQKGKYVIFEVNIDEMDEDITYDDLKVLVKQYKK